MPVLMLNHFLTAHPASLKTKNKSSYWQSKTNFSLCRKHFIQFLKFNPITSKCTVSKKSIPRNAISSETVTELVEDKDRSYRRNHSKRLRAVRKVIPVIIVPVSRKTQRKMFPANVPNLSMIFPWQMVNMMPNTYVCRTCS